MEELICWKCYCHVGWMNYAGPHGSVYCDECKEAEDREEAERLAAIEAEREKEDWED